MVLVSKVFLARVPGKACPVKKNGGTKKGRKRSTRGWECFRWREGECTNVVEGTHP